ncbi:MAG: transglycosylase domain-containing protein [Desulfobulbus sp.]|nr:transglycosylase domain-containing protein [Desulfobulbus sp.]
MLKFFKYCFFTFLLCSLLGGLLGAGGLYYLIVMAPCPEMDESAIAAILGRESPVYYRDGQNKIGVLFEGIHRQYLKYEEIPQNFVNALIASEDDEYFDHFGIDVPGILRAMVANLRAGHVVQGGSTITQQTAKNLFKRESRSIEAKLKELLYALRLEHRYSKEKILEFYCNQFFVSGNGHGLGVAARYFFDKDPQNLSLLECAFIAGSVKRPNYYNPFLRKNKTNAEEVRLRDEERVNYVLGKMRKADKLSDVEFAQLKASELAFKQGRMSYTQNTVMDLVKEGLETPFIADVLEENGISNISTSGARIITSLDKELQDRTLEALRRQLSQLDVRLRGYKRAEVQGEYEALGYSGDDALLPGSFVFGDITSIASSKEEGPSVAVQLKGGQGGAGRIVGTGFDRIADAYAKFTRGAGRASTSDRQALQKQLQAGDQIYVSIRSVNEDGSLQLDLEKYPRVEGAAYVLQEGAVRAMGGGMSNINYNRATTAKRLMGSTFKVFLFTAALQLGWSPVDMINNSRQTFMFMRQPYTPQPDHNSPFSEVSLSWAGVTSENVASVWLLYHLTDHLSSAQIKELATHVDMSPRVRDGEVETYQQYKERMRDRFGIVVSRDSLGQTSYSAAIGALKADFVFDNRSDEYQRIENLSYAEFLSLQGLVSRLNEFRQSPLQGSGWVDPDSAFDNPGAVVPATNGRLVRDTLGRFIYTLRSELPPNWEMVGANTLSDYLISLPSGQYDAFWNEQVQLDGVLSVNTLKQITYQMRQERDKVDGDKLYTLDVLSGVQDFRVMLGLQYMVSLAKACGIDSNFEPVLSLPLGSNVVSLSEMTRLYESIVTGSRHDAADAGTLAAAELDGHVDPDAASIIERIETPEGRVVYSRQVVKKRVVDPKSSAAVCNILQNVIPYGTGHYAKNHVRLRSDDPQRQKMLDKYRQPYPLLGKTGTANDYRNAAFLGYVPVLAQDQSGLNLESGYVVGVYTGFDANMPMVKGSFRVSGAQGALPAWSDIAQGILDVEKVADRIDPVDLTFNGLSLQYPSIGEVFVPVAPAAGGAMVYGAGLVKQNTPPGRPASLSFGSLGERGQFIPERLFMPYWKNK